MRKGERPHLSFLSILLRRKFQLGREKDISPGNIRVVFKSN